MTVYIITQAWDGEIRGVFLDKALADQEAKRLRALNQTPTTVEEHDVRETLTCVETA